MSAGGSGTFGTGAEKGKFKTEGDATLDWAINWLQSEDAQKMMGQLWPAINRISTSLAEGTPLFAPTEETMGAISPEVKAGVMAPYQETEQQLLETLGASGGLGSARGGFSGQGAAGVGKYWADVAPEYTKSLWGMTQPGLQYPYQAAMELLPGTMPASVLYPTGAEYEAAGKTKGASWGGGTSTGGGFSYGSK